MSEQTLKCFHLVPYRNVLVKNLSGGNRRKLSVAVTCLGSSSSVLMDEPTSDMDPVTRNIVYESIHRLLLENRSVIVTSHTITEIDRVCDRIGIMRQGKMIITAPPQQLKMMYGNRYSITVYYDQVEALTIERVRMSHCCDTFACILISELFVYTDINTHTFLLISGYQKGVIKH